MSVVFTYNSVTSTTMGLTVIDVNKPVIPPQHEQIIDIPKFSGAVQAYKKFIPNQIIVRCVLVGTSVADLVSNAKEKRDEKGSTGERRAKLIKKKENHP